MPEDQRNQVFHLFWRAVEEYPPADRRQLQGQARGGEAVRSGVEKLLTWATPSPVGRMFLERVGHEVVAEGNGHVPQGVRFQLKRG
jgi:hypothetical protein